MLCFHITKLISDTHKFRKLISQSAYIFKHEIIFSGEEETTTTSEIITTIITNTNTAPVKETTMSAESITETVNTAPQSLTVLPESKTTTEINTNTVIFTTETSETTTLQATTDSVQTNTDFELLSTVSTESVQKVSENSVELNLIDSKQSERKSRSLVDYIIGRSYDSFFDSRPLPLQRPPHVPVERLSFLVYGKYREYNINFMRYDTVLPFYYIPHLNALALKFPLDNTNYYLLLILPVDKNGIDQLICNLRFNGSLRYIIGNLRYQHVIATIPSFILKGYVSLTPTLQKVKKFLFKNMIF